MLIDLDTPSGLDPIRVGGKAAALAAARTAGATVLPGFVVTAKTSRRHMELGARALRIRGSGGARLAVSGEPIDFADELIATGRSMGDHLVARSSTLLESSAAWSGAFTSYVDIGPGDLPKAVVGCWASAFSVAALDRQAAAGITPGSFQMSVLVQPAVEPEAGGWAEMRQDGVVVVHGTKGPPTPLMQGWVSGETARYQDGWSGDGLREILGDSNLDAIREMLVLVGAKTGSNRCEWALTDRVWGLQFGRMAEAASREVVARPGADVVPELAEVVRIVLLAPGSLGEEMVLPWALRGLPDFDVSPADHRGDLVGRARELARQLVEDVWCLPWGEAVAVCRTVLAQLYGGDPNTAIDRIRRLQPAGTEKAARLIGILRRIRTEAYERGLVADQRDAWHLSLDSIESGLAGRPIAMAPRLGIGRWEPLVAFVVLGSTASPLHGTPASPGLGAGRRVEVAGDDSGKHHRRGVLVASQPIPAVAPLLWDAAAVTTRSGSPAAHVFEAARALRVPAVTDVDMAKSRDDIIAVDGSQGVVASMSLEREL